VATYYRVPSPSTVEGVRILAIPKERGHVRKLGQVQAPGDGTIYRGHGFRRSTTSGEWELLVNAFDGTPAVRHKFTRKTFVLPWEDLIELADGAGVADATAPGGGMVVAKIPAGREPVTTKKKKKRKGKR
jgi:hypothetical protein